MLPVVTVVEYPIVGMVLADGAYSRWRSGIVSFEIAAYQRLIACTGFAAVASGAVAAIGTDKAGLWFCFATVLTSFSGKLPSAPRI